MRTLIEVHKDESYCSNNDPASTTNCPKVGTGIHEPIQQHLARVHGLDEQVLWDIQLAFVTLENYQAGLELWHRRLHLDAYLKGLPTPEFLTRTRWANQP